MMGDIMKKIILIGMCILVVVLVGCLTIIEGQPPEHVWCEDMLIEFDIDCGNGTHIWTEKTDVRMSVYGYDFSDVDSYINKTCYPNWSWQTNTKTLDWLCVK